MLSRRTLLIAAGILIVILVAAIIFAPQISPRLVPTVTGSIATINSSATAAIVASQTQSAANMRIFWLQRTATIASISATAQVAARQTHDARILALNRWESANIMNYTMVVQVFGPFGQNKELTIIVRDGKVIQGETTDSVETLFHQSDFHIDPDQTLECIRQAQFDPVYGYPSSIGMSCPIITDSFGSINVVSFHDDSQRETF